MKFKLDENLGSRTVALFDEFGHEVETVSQEKLNGTSDTILYTVSQSEGRCLVTLDLDFADVIRFPPGNSHGIAVLRPPPSASLGVLAALVRNLLTALQAEPITGRLWVVEVGRIRVHESKAAARPDDLQRNCL